MTSLWVVIATAGRPDALRQALSSLANCVRPPEYRGTVVAENGPRLGAEAVVMACGAELKARYVHLERANKSAAIARALEEIDDGLVYLTDDDAAFSPDILTVYAEAARGAESGFYYGGPVRTEFDEAPPEWLLRYLPDSVVGWPCPGVDLTSPRLSFIGMNWAAFARDLRKIMPFDERFGPGMPFTGEEMDKQERLRRLGVRPVCLERAVVRHAVPKEHCSSDWALARARRQAGEHALKARESSAACRGWLRLAARAAGLACAGGAPWGFRARYLVSCARGAWDGIR